MCEAPILFQTRDEEGRGGANRRGEARLRGLREEVREQIGERERERYEVGGEHVLGDPLGVGGGEHAALSEDLARGGERVDHLAHRGDDARHLGLAELGAGRDHARGDELRQGGCGGRLWEVGGGGRAVGEERKGVSISRAFPSTSST